MKIKKISLLLTLCATMVAVFASGCDKNEQSGNSQSGEVYTDYYSSISSTDKGTTLLSKLHSLNDSKRKNVGWKEMRYKFKYSDVDPDGSGKVVSFYTNELMKAEWDGTTYNREHVWPDSRGGNRIQNDIHTIRPCASGDNSKRGNDVYGDGTNSTFDPGFAVPNYRGIAARIIFYCVVADPTLKLNDSTSNNGNNMGKLSLLLKWNDDYPPSTSETAALELRLEQNRNNYIFKNLQKNRNPFIDHPEFARKIWG